MSLPTTRISYMEVLFSRRTSLNNTQDHMEYWIWKIYGPQGSNDKVVHTLLIQEPIIVTTSWNLNERLFSSGTH